MCVSPRAPPPESTTPIFGRRVGPGAAAGAVPADAAPAASSACAAVGIAIASAMAVAAVMMSPRAIAASCGMRAERPLFAWYADG